MGRLVKGRFMRGNVAYVTDTDLGLYAAAFRRPLRDPIPRPARRIIDLLEQSGPMRKSVLREMTSIERNRFTRALTSLNRAFEVMEIQRAVEWDSPWDLGQRAYPDADPDAWQQADAQAEVLRRFTKSFGPATLVEMINWSGWDRRTVRELLDRLLAGQELIRVQITGESEPAYLASEDAEALETIPPVEGFVVVLPPNDPLVLPQWSHLKDRYQPYPLPYCYGVIVADGEIAGAAWGPYRRRYIHIEELNLEPAIVDDPLRMDEVLATLESYLGGGQTPIHIYGINGTVEAPWIGEILARNGFVQQDRHYVKRIAH